MTLLQKQFTFSKNLTTLFNWLIINKYDWSIGGAYRTEYQEKEYKRLGLSHTNNSLHLKKLAIDLNIFKDGKYLTTGELLKPIGDYWCKLNEKNRWGGDWNKNGIYKDEKFLDLCHFEMQE
jgi:hypothetical protein